MRTATTRPRPPVLDHIIEALSGLEFGAVEITVHHGRIVQIERREKVRLENQRDELTGSPEAAGSNEHNIRDAS